MALDPNYKGTFDPSTETRPDISYPDSLNLVENSSAELSQPLTAVGDCDVEWSTEYAHSGERSTKVTLNPGKTTDDYSWARLPVSVPGGSTHYLSVAVYIEGGSALFDETLHIGYTDDTTPPTVLTDQILGTGWNQPYIPMGTDSASYLWVGFDSAAIDAEYFWVDTWLVLDSVVSSGWEPADGEPFYTYGQYWVVSHEGTFQGFDLEPGDTVTCVSPYFRIADDAEWEVTTSINDYAEAVITPPVSSAGTPVGYEDWRIAVQMLTPTNVASRFDIARFDVDTFSFYKWTDLTPYLRGMEWSRGSSEFAGRPESGTATIELDNADNQFSPSNYESSFEDLAVSIGGELFSSSFGPGSVIRIVAFSPTWEGTQEESWVPQFTGLVTSWPEETEGVGKDRYVTIEAVETIAQLARVDDNALDSVEGNDDLPMPRIERLADAADWQFGYLDEFDFEEATSYELQSTDMASNRLSEMFLTADSVGAVVRTDRTGRIYLYNQPPIGKPIRGPIGTTSGGARFDTAEFDVDEFVGEGFNGLSPNPYGEVGGVYTIPWVYDSLITENDDVAIINHAAFAKAGGSQQVASDTASIRRYGRISTSRNDLVCKSNDLCLYLAEQAVANRARLTYRVGKVQLHNHHPNTAPAIISLDVHSAIRVAVSEAPKLVAESAVVDYLQHRVQPLNGSSVVWTLDIAFGRQDHLYTL